MLTLIFLYRRAPWPLRILALAVIFIGFASAIVRSHEAIRHLKERQQHVHTPRNPR